MTVERYNVGVRIKWNVCESDIISYYRNVILKHANNVIIGDRLFGVSVSMECDSGVSLQ